MRALALCVVMLAVASLATAVEQARACSCVQPDPWSLMKQADGAFVGRLIEREDIGHGRARLTFDVERAVKGTIGSSVDVVTANNGAACGIELPIGNRTGLFLVREGGRWTGTLCWQVSPDDLLAAATLPAPNGRWPAAMFVGGRFGPARTIALDAKGRTLGYGVGSGTVRQLAGCPGGRRVAELVERGSTLVVAIRELPTFWLVREQRLRRLGEGAASIRCVDALGVTLAVFSSGPDARGLLTRITSQRVTTLWRGTAFSASFWKRVAFVQALGGHGTKIISIDLESGVTKPLGSVRANGLYELSPNAAGTMLAGASYEEGCRTEPCAHLVVVDLARRPVSARRVRDRKECCGFVAWTGNNRFAYVNDGQIYVYTPTLRLVGRISGWTAARVAMVGNTAYGVTHSGELRRAVLPSGKVLVVRRLPGKPDFITTPR